MLVEAPSNITSKVSGFGAFEVLNSAVVVAVPQRLEIDNSRVDDAMEDNGQSMIYNFI